MAKTVPKIMRVIALSKRPSDFKRPENLEPPPDDAPAPDLPPDAGLKRVTFADFAALSKTPRTASQPDSTPTVGTEHTIGVEFLTPTVGEESPHLVSSPSDLAPTVGTEHTVCIKSAPAASPHARPGKPRPARTVQDGHSIVEQLLYDTLWKTAPPTEHEQWRQVAAGYHRLSKATHLDWTTIKRNLRSLQQKLALEPVGRHDSDTRTATTYRVYSFTAILKRRKAAGLEWCSKNRGGVTLIRCPEDSAPTVDTEHTVGTLHRGTVGTEHTVPVGAESPHLKEYLGHSFRTTSSSALVKISTVLGDHGIDADDAAVATLIRNCQAKAPDATVEEIAHFTALKAEQIRLSRTVRNPMGFLQTAVPACFEGELLRRHRQAQAASQAQGREAAESLRRELETMLADPNATEEDRAFARRMLAQTEL